MKNNKVIGVLGGMGPEASLETYKRIIRYAQKKYNAVQDFEYPHVIINSITLNDFNETGILDDASVFKQLLKGAKMLEVASCKAIVMACNTVHVFWEKLAKGINVPLFNMVDLTIEKAKLQKHAKLFLLSSKTTKESGLYTKSAEKNGMGFLTINEDEQLMLDAIIRNMMSGKIQSKDRAELLRLIDKYYRLGANAVVLGCTELPILINQSHTKVPVFDSLQVAVEAIVDFAYEN